MATAEPNTPESLVEDMQDLTLKSDIIKVLSWNINGMKAKLMDLSVVKKIFDKYDIVLLQETHIGKRDNGEDDDKDWTLINDKLSDKYDFVKLEEEEEEKKKKEEEKEEKKKEEEKKKKKKKKKEEEKKKEEKEEEKKKKKKKEEKEEEKKKEEKEDEKKKKKKKKKEEKEEEKKKEEKEEEKKKEEKEEEKKKKKKKTMYLTYFSSRSEGVAILINKPHTLLKSFKGGDFAWVHVEIDGQKYTFVSVYYHRKANDQIHDLMLEILSSFLTEGSDVFKCRLVIGGDLNTTLNPELDLTSENPEHTPRRKTLNAFLRIVKLSDVWREKHAGERQYTYHWTDKDKEEQGSRLDYVFMLEKDVKYVHSCVILNEIALSDHSPVSLTLKRHSTA